MHRGKADTRPRQTNGSEVRHQMKGTPAQSVALLGTGLRNVTLQCLAERNNIQENTAQRHRDEETSPQLKEPLVSGGKLSPLCSPELLISMLTTGGNQHQAAAFTAFLSDQGLPFPRAGS